jgi:hypothetical protein
MKNPFITIHYIDGSPSETREMTDAEVLECFPEGLQVTDDASTDSVSDSAK